MRKFLSSLQAVLWALIGLGGRRTDADKRADQGSLAWILVLAVVFVLLLVGGLVGTAKWAAGW
ncbi:DUF2970 domain-containing protein [Diaphorobacter caeni]|uniref:DUF2970 domain-containing protein n=1 Tax=Diaphorobacter caeni TaxID=2784387 RepID=UPI00188F6171|nr:DUF2970 domain-containing protein [Diaphorobacter caeni]MBF5007113.1 DUF2970 domain-containing protein [Diaphorobacter caeni]